MVKQNSSKRGSSHLIERFIQQCGLGDLSPEQAIRTLASSLAAKAAGDLDALLPIRNIDRDVGFAEELPCDGMIEPKGHTYKDGFIMRLRRGQGDRRLRFTKAHEICHTFFYELAPELKFRAHGTDPVEERLCNIGAEELLMPLASVTTEACLMPVSIESLMVLAKRFDVSASAMLVRLRQARLWRCELAYWHRMLDGSFVLDRKTGGRKANWQMDSSILNTVWDNHGGKRQSGVTFIYFEQGGLSAAERVYYQAKRHGASVVTLLCKREFPGRRQDIPLLFRNSKHRRFKL
jgi:hypothetical protein